MTTTQQDPAPSSICPRGCQDSRCPYCQVCMSCDGCYCGEE